MPPQPRVEPPADAGCPQEPERSVDTAGGAEQTRRGRKPSPSLRRSLLRVQQHRCLYTGENLLRVPLSSDHVIPLSRGGSTGLSNILVCRQEVNCDKNGHLPGPHLLQTWAQYLLTNRTRLQQAGVRHGWDLDVPAQLAAAAAVYRTLQDGELLWEGPGRLRAAEADDRAEILELLARTTG